MCVCVGERRKINTLTYCNKNVTIIVISLKKFKEWYLIEELFFRV